MKVHFKGRPGFTLVEVKTACGSGGSTGTPVEEITPVTCGQCIRWLKRNRHRLPTHLLLQLRAREARASSIR